MTDNPEATTMGDPTPVESQITAITAITGNANPVEAALDFITWDDLSTMAVTTLPLPKYGNKVMTFKSFIPLEDMAELQAKFLGGNRKDYLGYSMAVLKSVMINPAIKTDESFRALRKADSGVLLEIVGKVTSSQQAQEISENLGNV